MNLLLEIIKKQGHIGKGTMMDITYGKDAARKIDSAFPCGITERLRELGLERISNSANYCYDYNHKSFGDLANVNDDFVIKLFEQLRNDHYYIQLSEVYHYLKQFADYFEKEVPQVKEELINAKFD